jgi:hypothetical protein
VGELLIELMSTRQEGGGRKVGGGGINKYIGSPFFSLFHALLQW